jgi:endonuclease/exonuclease/phosphatase family metal-dependent hydrolase
MNAQSSWIDNLRKYKTVDRLKASAFFTTHGTEIEAYLKTPQFLPCTNARPRLDSFLRIVQWNIEKGKRFQQILERLQTDGVLKWADVVIINEADFGMSRSENRNIAKDLAEALEMHAVFGPAHFELTKGTDEELFLEGENQSSLQGNAVLSRYPISEAFLVPLPVSFEPYEFQEKRFGWRSCLWVRIELKSSHIWVGAVHLELRNTPQCRAQQVMHILASLPGDAKDAYVLAGDLNTNSFSRGTTWRTLKSIMRLLLNSPVRIKAKLLHPERGSEPLFKHLTGSGFEWKGLNSNEETARTTINSLEETGSLPGPAISLIKNRLEPYQGYLCFKLDWILGRAIQPLSAGQKQDSMANIFSLNPGSVKMENSGPGRISDHLPIYADIDLA